MLDELGEAGPHPNAVDQKSNNVLERHGERRELAFHHLAVCDRSCRKSRIQLRL